MVLFSSLHDRRRWAGLAVVLAVLASTSACSSPEPTEPTPQDTFEFSFNFDTTPPADVDEDLISDAAAEIEDADVVGVVGVVGVALEVTPVLDLGTRVAMVVQVTRANAEPGPPQDGEVVEWTIDGQLVEPGPKFTASGTVQLSVTLWKGAKTGEVLLTGVRPGTAMVGVRVAGIDASAVQVTVGWPAAQGMGIGVVDTQAWAAGERTADSEDTIKLAAGNLLTIQFPASAIGGAEFDFAKVPAKGTLKVSTVLPALGNLQMKLVAGRLWVDQVDKGQFRGTFVGTTADLKPMVGVFAVARDGKFGVDLLGEPVKVKTSVVPIHEELTTGDHFSRASLFAVGGGQAVLTFRHIQGTTKGDLVRIKVDAATGVLDESLPPLVVGAGTWQQNPPKPLQGVGYAAAATSEGQLLAVWEGRDGKGVLPLGIWMRPIGPDGALQGDAAILVATDACDGSCQPRIAALPSSRWVIAWAVPNGQGIRARRVQGDLTFIDDKPVQIVPSPATSASLAVLDDKVALAWRHPNEGSEFRIFTDTLTATNPEQYLNGGVDLDPEPAIVGMTAPVGFVALFVGGSPATLRFRRIDLSGTKVGPADVDLAAGVDRVVAAAGKPSQLALIERVPGAGGAGVMRIRKLAFTSSTDPGKQLGPALEVPVGTNLPVRAEICYVPEADVYVAAWSGEAASEGVWILRFR
jgi:hypothetical protein